LHQKRVDEVRRIRKAMVSGGSVLANKERTDIVEYARIMGWTEMYLWEGCLLR
jgi:hypothetical protein